MIFGVALLAPMLVRPLSARDRPPAGALPGPHRHARARERHPPAAAHRGHRLGADDRRSRSSSFVTIFAAGLRATIDKGIDEQVTGRRHRRPPGRLLAAAERRRRDAAPGRRRRAPSRRSGSRPALCAARTATTRRDRHRSGHDRRRSFKLEVGRRRRADARGARGRCRRWSAPGLRRRQQRRRSATADADDAATATQVDYAVAGTFKNQASA